METWIRLHNQLFGHIFHGAAYFGQFYEFLSHLEAEYFSYLPADTAAGVEISLLTFHLADTMVLCKQCLFVYIYTWAKLAS